VIRNNLISLIVHSTTIFIIAFISWDKLNLELPFFITVMICILLSAIYISIGACTMVNNGAFIKNLFSTSSIIILGIVIWTICFTKIDYNHLYSAFGDDGFVTEWWMWHDSFWVYFDAYKLAAYTFTFPIEIAFMILYINEFHMMIIDIINIFYIFMPSFLFCFGIYIKSRYKDRHVRFG